MGVSSIWIQQTRGSGEYPDAENRHPDEYIGIQMRYTSIRILYVVTIQMLQIGIRMGFEAFEYAERHPDAWHDARTLGREHSTEREANLLLFISILAHNHCYWV